MIVLNRITDKQDSRLDQIIDLYVAAFPQEERRDLNQLRLLIEKADTMYLNAIEANDTLCGFFIYWDMGGFYYLEHLAVFPEMRNMKIGQQVLDYIAAHLDGTRILEVEPTTDEMTTRRVNYYSRNGYHIVDKSYMQPSYRPGEEDFPLWIMSNNTTDDLSAQIEQIKDKVYRGNYALL